MNARHWLYVGLSLLLLLLAWQVRAEGIVFKMVSIGEENGQILLDLLERHQLTDTMLEALENGVPLTFVTRVEIEPEELPLWQLWSEPVVRKIIIRQLRYHPLSEEYEVYDLSTRLRRRFATREAALSYLGELKGVVLVAAKRLRKGHHYQVRISSEHDIGALPLPLRPRAYLSPSWHLSSKVYEWRLTP